MVHTLIQPHAGQRFLGDLSPLLASHTSVYQRQLHIFDGGQGGDQVESLEDKADLLIADHAHLVVGQILYQVAVDVILPAGGYIQQTKHIHQGGFTGAGLADNGYELTLVNGQAYAVQRVHLVLAGVVDFINIAYINQVHDGTFFN